MRFPWANSALLVLLLVQLTSGLFGFVNGLEEHRWLLWVHGAGAYAISLLLFWKATIVLDVYRRRTEITAERLVFIVLSILLLGTLMFGLIWTFIGPIYLFGFSLLTLHIFLAVILMVLVTWHFWRLRWILRSPAAVNRRAFLNSATLALGGLLFWSGLGRMKEHFMLAGASRRFTGSYERGSFSGQFPSVSWIADDPPPISTENWELVIDNSDARDIRYTYADILAKDAVEISTILDCTGGWYTEQYWRGVPLADLLTPLNFSASIKSVTVKSVTGYQRRFRLDEIGSFILATHVANQALTQGHGFPLRLVAPGQRGVNWVKWVSQISLNESPKWWQPPLPLQ